jgi:hypothetical protein
MTVEKVNTQRQLVTAYINIFNTDNNNISSMIFNVWNGQAYDKLSGNID